MKNKYEEILTTQENGRKIQITRSSSYFIVKIGRDGMKHYQKKAQSERCYDLDSLKRHLRQICSLNSIDYDRLENRLIKAIKPRGEGVYQLPMNLWCEMVEYLKKYKIQLDHGSVKRPSRLAMCQD